ncbi:FAD-binding oxidoreductase [Rhabdothermincola sediminis]|uniref:FAD-binding oxidoreductase n=1 Tax=Rhabdothermincola sediminis TaxID=2751370 RepID=UPI001AA0A8FD|nr:FAD-binding oxidoreductase [Rhabdothermincola sediminis]
MTEDPRATDDQLGPGAPTAPIELAGGPASAAARLGLPFVEVDDAMLDRLRGVCASVTRDAAELAEASRDWWPLAMTWALDGQVASLAAAVARPTTPAEVAEVVRVCDAAGVPVTAAAGRSGVCGGSIPLYGGVVLDLCGLSGIRDVDDASLVVDVAPGTFGDHFEYELRSGHGLTVGHWPQSMALSTVGGWLACRSAGQLSTRYGKIEDLVVGLDVVLADGRTIHTGGHARQASGPDLNQLFVGSEGTLGIIVGVRLRARPVPPHTRHAAFGFSSFEDGLDACRRILRRGATPAVLRLYDPVEGERNFGTGELAPLLVYDEGDGQLVDPTLEIVEEECETALALDAGLVDRWMAHRNDVSALEALISRGYVVDTMEVTGPWAALPRIYRDTLAAIGSVEGTLVASAHQSHSYPDGACLYFTFAGKPEPGDKDRFYRAVWDAGTRAVLAAGGSLSHHHGVGVNRGRFMREALGGGFDVLAAVKHALDPNGILNPGKLGLPSPFGPDPLIGPN